MKIARQEAQASYSHWRALALARDERPCRVRIIPQLIVVFRNHPREVPLVLLWVVDPIQADFG